MSLEANGVPVIGTSPDAIDRAEDRERFQQLVERLDLLQPENATVTSTEEAMLNQLKLVSRLLFVHRMY